MSHSSRPESIFKPPPDKTSRAQGAAMNKPAIFLFLAAFGLAGCKTVTPADVISAPEPISIPAPEPTSPSLVAKTEWVATTVRKDTFADSVPPINQPRSAIVKAKHEEKHRFSPVAGKVKPAGLSKKEVSEMDISVSPMDRPTLPAIPKDVWYAIATIFGAVFTSLLAPIAVEIIRERRALAKLGKQENESAN